MPGVQISATTNHNMGHNTGKFSGNSVIINIDEVGEICLTPLNLRQYESLFE